MGILEAFLYGLIQGTTEFLPISSSGHLALLPKVLVFKDPGVLFDLAMHLGTALAVGLYFLKDIKKILVSAFKICWQKKIMTSSDALSANMIVATLVTAVLGLLLKEWAFAYGRNSSLIAFNLIFFGILMAWIDHRSVMSKDNQMNKFRPFQACLIGLFQVLAIFPGVSRSGATLTISRFLRLSRHEAGRFSFLLSLPLILGGSLLEFSRLNHTELNFSWGFLLLGILISFLVGIVTIHYFLKWISRVGLLPFAIYRILLGVAVFIYLV